MADDADPIDDITEEDENGILQCWCGAKGTFEKLFDDAVFEESCGGSGVLYCYCGGDFCVCHHHGEVECPGCEDCGNEEGGDWDDGNLESN